MTKKVLLLAAAVLMFQTAPVFAEGSGDGGKKGPHGARMFEKHDTNDDGVITKDEFIGHAEERFTTMDADGNGEVSKEEVRSAGKAMREKMKDKRAKWKEKREKASDSE
jgi:hypothetical protein